MALNRWILGMSMVLGVATSGVAATITWDPISTATGNASDVVTTGTFFDSATSYATTNVTLNGVEFKRNLNSDNFFASGITFTNRQSAPTSFSTPPVSWDSAYKTLGTWGIYQTTANGGVNINLNGLNVGQNYLVQLWLPYWNQNWKTNFTAVNSSGFLNHGVNPSITSQYVVGHFTADATTQTINATGTTSPAGYGIPGFLQVRYENGGTAQPGATQRVLNVDFNTSIRATVDTPTPAGFKADINAGGQNTTNDQIGVWEKSGSAANWWNYTGTSAAAGSLVDSDGNPWNLTISMSGLAGAASDWSNGGFVTPNDDLASDGYYASEAGTVTTTIGNLAPGKLYDLIVFHADDYVSENVTVNGMSPSNYLGAFSAYSDAFDGMSGSDFWYFRNLTPNGLNQLVISSSGSPGSHVGLGAANTITGFQLVQVPEPVSIRMLLWGSSLYVFKRRRGR